MKVWQIVAIGIACGAVALVFGETSHAGSTSFGIGYFVGAALVGAGLAVLIDKALRRG